MKRLYYGFLGIFILSCFIGVSVVFGWWEKKNPILESVREDVKRNHYTFTVGETGLSQYTLDQITGFIPPKADTKTKILKVPQYRGDIPEYYSWLDKDALTPIKNQGNCGSCWSFATTGVFESLIKIKFKVITDLAEQYLVSCNLGGTCRGGYHADAFNEMKKGMPYEACFPYVAKDGNCHKDCPLAPYQIVTYGKIGSNPNAPDIAQLKTAIVTYGPIAVTVTATTAMQYYKDGVFNEKSTQQTNHVVVLVGWDESKGAWLMRNSWGESWGMKGYCWIAYTSNYIGTYPIGVSEIKSTEPGPGPQPTDCQKYIDAVKKIQDTINNIPK